MNCGSLEMRIRQDNGLKYLHLPSAVLQIFSHSLVSFALSLQIPWPCKEVGWPTPDLLVLQFNHVVSLPGSRCRHLKINKKRLTFYCPLILDGCVCRVAQEIRSCFLSFLLFFTLFYYHTLSSFLGHIG